MYTQAQIEQLAFEDAQRRRDRELQRALASADGSNTTHMRKHVRSALASVIPEVSALLLERKSGKGSADMSVPDMLRATGLDAKTIAYLGLKGLYNRMILGHTKDLKVTATAFTIGEMIHDEARLSHFRRKETLKRLALRLLKVLKKRNAPRHTIRKTFKNYFDKERIDWSIWTKSDKIKVGLRLLGVMSTATGQFRIETVHYKKDGKPRRANHIVPTAEATLAAQQAFESRVTDFQVYPPMVEKPRPWTERHLFRGSYHDSKLIRRYPLVKRGSKRNIERMAVGNWKGILEAVNAIQETPYQINTTILSTLSHLMSTFGGDVAGLPPANDIPVPPKPPGYGEDEEVTARHNRYVFEHVHDVNRQLIGKRLQVLSAMATARSLMDNPEVYFPVDMDHRGRIYSKPAFLHTQGPDYMKALLEFSNPVPIDTPEARQWLAVAGANAAGQDKIGLADRLAWVEANEPMILACAADPLANMDWAKQDEPFMFLRFCLEWAGLKEHGYGFLSRMPIHLDATCSGLQHYSAMLRDDIGGQSVNLKAGLPRQDIYGDVARRVREKLQARVDADDDDAYQAQLWLDFGIDRKITKRQVMVVPYAATIRSCFEYTEQAAEEKVRAGALAPWDTTGEAAETASARRKAVKLLSDTIWTSISEVVVKGREAMEWLRAAGMEYAKVQNQDKTTTGEEKALSWTTPDGFTVYHKELDTKGRDIETVLDGKTRLRLRINEETERLDTRGMGSAIAPNFVHSMDAALLRMAVVKGLERGITDYAMIHDSFGTHAGNIGRFLNECIKPAFIELYADNDVLLDLRDQMPDIELPPVPTKGSLDLNEVLGSEFFFS